MHTLTTLGYATAVVLMAVFVVVNYFGIRWFARINNVLVWWKLGMIALVIVAFLVTAFHTGNFSDHGFAPSGSTSFPNSVWERPPRNSVSRLRQTGNRVSSLAFPNRVWERESGWVPKTPPTLLD